MSKRSHHSIWIACYIAESETVGLCLDKYEIYALVNVKLRFVHDYLMHPDIVETVDNINLSFFNLNLEMEQNKGRMQ